MAGITFPSITSRTTCTPRIGACSCAKIRSSCANSTRTYSRASAIWIPRRPIERSTLNGGLADSNVYFSTSLIRRSKAKDGGRDDPDRNQVQKPSPKSRLTETIRSKLSALDHENIYTFPNILTFSRLLATPVIGYLIIHDQHAWAVGLFAYAGVTDLVDGWLARRWKQQTVVGSVVDPMADKALMTTLVGCLAVNGGLPVPLATIILGRDISLAIAAIYYRYASLPAPKTFMRYWDFSLPSAEVHPTTVSKLNTFLQLILIGATLTMPLVIADTSAASSTIIDSVRSAMGGSENVQNAVKVLQGIVAGTTIWSGLSYAFLRDAVKILGPDEALKRKQGFRGRMIILVSFGSVLGLSGWLAWRDRTKEEDTER